MITKQELEEAIAECENLPSSYQSCEKLATFYAVYDHLYGSKISDTEPISREYITEQYGKSEFFTAIRDKKEKSVFGVIDELMSTLQIVNPKLYNATLNKIETI